MPPKGDLPPATLGKQVQDEGNHKLEEHLDNQEKRVESLKGEVGHEEAVKTLDAKKPDEPPNPMKPTNRRAAAARAGTTNRCRIPN